VPRRSTDTPVYAGFCASRIAVTSFELCEQGPPEEKQRASSLQAGPKKLHPIFNQDFFLVLVFVSIPGAICASASSPCLACSPYGPLGSSSTAFW
jgi:hypothetical protein